MSTDTKQPITRLERVAVWLRDTVMGTTYTTHNPWETAPEGDRGYWLGRATEMFRVVCEDGGDD